MALVTPQDLENAQADAAALAAFVNNAPGTLTTRTGRVLKNLAQLVAELAARVGPTGPAGPTGATGAAGAQGPAGSINAIGSNLDFGNTYKGVNLPAPVNPNDSARKADVDAAGFICSGRITGSTGALVGAKGSITPTASRTSTGVYSVGVAGLTVNGVIIVTVHSSAGFYTVMVNGPFASSFAITVQDAGGTYVDKNVSFAVLSL